MNLGRPTEDRKFGDNFRTTGSLSTQTSIDPQISIFQPPIPQKNGSAISPLEKSRYLRENEAFAASEIDADRERPRNRA
jgi:hypothetical protein